MIVSIVIVNFNGRRFLPRLLKSIQDQTEKKIETIFVDNGSSDNSIEYVLKNFKKVIVVKSKNNGFGAGCNIGAKNAKGEFLMFLNEDMYIPKDFVESMLKEYIWLDKTKENVGALGCKIIPFDSNPKKTPPYYGGKIDFFGFPTDNRDHEKSAFIINGCPFLIKRRLFLDAKGFNPNIFLYGEDEDVCWRLKLMGYNHYVNNNTYLFHFGGGAINKFMEKKVANVVGSPLIPMISNYGTLSLLAIIPFYIVYFILLNIGIFIITRFNIRYNVEIFKVYWRVFSKIEDLLRFRSFVQNKRIKNDLVLLKEFSLVPSVIINKSFKRL